MTSVADLGSAAKSAARALATASTDAKNEALLAAADLLVARSSELLAANARDIEAAQAAGMEAGPLDRLTLTDARIVGMGNGLRTVALVEDTAYDTAVELMQATEYVDCLIPRGGPALIQSIRDNARVPVIIDGDGNCHVYVDVDADPSMAQDIVVNAKTQRTSVCNAAESLVFHAGIAPEVLPAIAKALMAEGVELVGDARAQELVSGIGPATDHDFGREFLDRKASVAVVPDLDAAIAHINRYGTGHTEAIVTNDLETARRFVHEVDAAATMVNASTRFTDGEEFGFGAEIGISTQKLHARGPMGLRELTTYQYVVWGDGQVRT